jgi:hypothetical protein
MTSGTRRPFGGTAVLAALLWGGPFTLWYSSQELVEVRGAVTGFVLDPDAGAVLTVGARRIIVPADLEMEFPGQRLAAAAVFAQAPAACRDQRRSGLERGDDCLGERRDRFTPPQAIVHASPTKDGTLSAVAVTITAPGRVSGAVTFIHPEEGYVRIRGEYGADAGGTLLRLNDPSAARSAQGGIACGSEGNCSPDVRFGIDLVGTGVGFEGAGAACIPSSVSAGACPAAREGDWADQPVAPLQVGDHVVAVGAFEALGGTTAFVAHTMTVTAPLSR